MEPQIADCFKISFVQVISQIKIMLKGDCCKKEKDLGCWWRPAQSLNALRRIPVVSSSSTSQTSSSRECPSSCYLYSNLLSFYSKTRHPEVWKIIKKGNLILGCFYKKNTLSEVCLSVELLYLILITLRYVSRFGPLTSLEDFITVLPASLGYTAAQWAAVHKALRSTDGELREAIYIFTLYIHVPSFSLKLGLEYMDN